MKKLVLMLGVLLMVVPACKRAAKPLAFKMCACREYTFCATSNDKGILYGFFYLPTSIPYNPTDDPQAQPAANGIHWLRTSANGLWVNGKQVDTSTPGTYLAIQPDGTVQRVVLDEPTIKVLTAEVTAWVTDNVNMDPVRAVLKEPPKKQ